MELRRFKDILALKSEEGTLVGFHARNMEVAQISEPMWNSMCPTNLLMADPTARLFQDGEAMEELKAWETEENPAAQTLQIKPVIRYLTLNVTQICNLHCSYCAAGGDGTFGDAIAKISIEKTLPQLQYFLDRTPENESFNINFLGGEPLLYAEGLELIFVHLSTIAPQRKINYTVITNGTLLTEKNVDLLARMKAAVTISVDGPAEINDRMRPTKNGASSTAMVIEGLKRLLSRKSELRHISLHGVFDSNNSALLDAYEFYSQFDVDQYDFSFSVSDNNPRANADFMGAMEQLAAKAYSQGGEAKLRKIRSFDQHFESLDFQRRNENFCGAGKSFLMIDARHQIYTCPWDVNDKNEQVGEGIELDEKALSSYQQPLLERNNCHNCWARFLCGGGCMFAHKQASGKKNVKNIQFCERTRFIAALALIYYEKCRSAA